jgi:hypothetical protein
MSLGMVWTERSSLAVDLWRYGEDELWKRVLTLPDRTMRQIGERADYYLLHGPTTDAGKSMLIAQALALAAVEVLEGAARPLKRMRRRPEKEFPGFPRFRSWIARRWLDRQATGARAMVTAARRR